MNTVRLYFSQTGLIKYISHLDMARLFARLIRRTDIPIRYTEGFNPRPYISFPLPLPLGVEGLREPVDIGLTDPADGETEAGRASTVAEKLGSVLPEGLTIVGYEDGPVKTVIRSAVYEISFPGAGEKELTAALSGGLTAQKTGKEGGKKVIKTVDLAPFLHDLTIKSRGDGSVLTVRLPAGDKLNISPLLLTQALCAKGIAADGIIRTELSYS